MVVWSWVQKEQSCSTGLHSFRKPQYGFMWLIPTTPSLAYVFLLPLIYIYFPSFCSLFPVICWAVNQNLTFNRHIQPSTLPFANIMALGSAATSSLISVAFKWHTCKKPKCSLNISSLSLLPFFPSFLHSFLPSLPPSYFICPKEATINNAASWFSSSRAPAGSLERGKNRKENTTWVINILKRVPSSYMNRYQKFTRFRVYPEWDIKSKLARGGDPWS